MAARDPFGLPIPHGGRLFIGFLRAAPPAAAKKKVAALGTATDAFCVHGRELSLAVRDPVDAIHCFRRDARENARRTRHAAQRQHGPEAGGALSIRSMRK